MLFDTRQLDEMNLHECVYSPHFNLYFFIES